MASVKAISVSYRWRVVWIIIHNIDCEADHTSLDTRIPLVKGEGFPPQCRRLTYRASSARTCRACRLPGCRRSDRQRALARPALGRRGHALAIYRQGHADLQPVDR